MAKSNAGRWRCLVTGCNPELNEASAAVHKEAEGHRVAAWPVRSKEGRRRARERNRSGYYDKYNVGAKSAEARGFTPGIRGGLLAGTGITNPARYDEDGVFHPGEFVLTGENFSWEKE